VGESDQVFRGKAGMIQAAAVHSLMTENNELDSDRKTDAPRPVGVTSILPCALSRPLSTIPVTTTSDRAKTAGFGVPSFVVGQACGLRHR